MDGGNKRLIRLCADISDVARGWSGTKGFRGQLLNLMVESLSYDRAVLIEGPNWISNPRRPLRQPSDAFAVTTHDWLPVTSPQRFVHYSREVWNRGGREAYLAPMRGWCEIVDLFENTSLRGSDIHNDYVRAYGLRVAPMRHWLERHGVFNLTFGRNGRARYSDREALALDLTFPLVRVTMLLDRPAPPGRRARTTDLGLSPRRAEIAALVARGLRNQEIATLLGVSRLTVRNHLSEVFANVGVSTRAELAGLVNTADS